MKKITGILAAMALLPAAAYAENDASIERGAVEVGGDMTLDLSTGSVKQKFDAPGAVEQKIDTSTVELDVSGLYYVAPNVGLGLAVLYSKETQEADGIEETSSTAVVGPAISAQLPLAPQVALFGLAAVGYASSTFSATGDPDLEASGFGFVLRGGIKYFVAKQFSLDVGLRYTLINLERDAIVTATGTIPELDTKVSTVGVSAGLSVYFGR